MRKALKKTCFLIFLMFFICAPAVPAAAQDGTEPKPPSEEQVLNKLIDASIQAKDYKKASKYFEELSGKAKLGSDQRMRWAKAAELSGDPGKALKILEPLEKAKEPSVKAVSEAAQLCVQIKAFAKAAERYARLSKLQPDNEQWPLQNAKCLVWADKHAEAAVVLARISASKPKDATIRRMYADSLYFSGAGKKAVAEYEKLLGLIPETSTKERSQILERMVNAAFQAKDYQKAYLYCGKLAVQVKMLSSEYRLKWAKAAELIGKRNEALKILGPLEKAEKPSPKVIAEAAQLCVQLKLYVEAAARYKKLSTLQPVNEKWPLLHATSLAAASKHAEAAGALAALTAKKPKDPQLLKMYADSLYFSGSGKKALPVYEQLLKLVPASEQTKILNRMIEVAFQVKDFSRAGTYFQQLAAKSKTLPAAQIMKWAKAAELAGKPGDALKILAPLENLKNPSPQVIIQAAQLCVQNKAYAEAANRYAVLVGLQPENKQWPLLHAKTLIWAGRHAQAAKILGELAEKRPGDKQVIRLQADSLYYSQMFEKAIAAYEKLLQDHPDQPVLRLNIARCYMATQKYGRAVPHFEYVYRQDSADIKIGAELAKALYLAGNLDNASRMLTKLLKVEPRNIELLRTAADLEAERQNFAGSIELYRRGIEAGDKRRETRIRLAQVLSWDRRYNEALVEYNHLIERRPEDHVIRREKARMLGWDRRYNEAIKTYQEALEIDPTNRAVKKEMLAKQAYYRGHDVSAIPLYRSLIETEPNNPEARFDLGQAYSRQSMWPEAREAYNQTLEMFPEHNRAGKCIDEVNLLSTATEVVPFFRYIRRKSGARTVDVRKYAFGSSAAHWLTDRVKMTGEYTREELDFTGGNDSAANVYKLGLDYISGPRWNVGGWAGARIYDGGENEFLYNIGLTVATLPGLDATVYSRRREHLENAVTFRNRLYRIDNGVSLHYRPDDNFQALGGYERSCLSDGNELGTTFGEVRYKLLREPRRLTVSYRVEHWSFDRTTVNYFSPGSFVMHSVRLDWRHYLGRNLQNLRPEELYWGSRRSYYELGYHFGWDTEGEHGHTLRAGLYHEFNDRVRLNFTGSMTRGTVYDADQAMVSVSLFFGGKER